MEWWLKHTGQVAHLPQDYSLIGLYLISTATDMPVLEQVQKSVNALSGLYLISTMEHPSTQLSSSMMCQCPLGLIPHFYAIKYSGTVYIKVAGCQCPLGLIPHFYNDRNDHEAF